MRLAVIGAGWAGLAAAVRATQAGHHVTLFDMAPQAGGRARSDGHGAAALDNGQHILLGGYSRTLALMRDVGVDPRSVLLRSPLAVCWPDGTRFALGGHGPRAVDALGALLRARGFAAADKVALARSALAWRRARFHCEATLTVAELLQQTATATLRRRLLEPLCVAALNTRADEASARVFLAVLRDSLFGERGASDLLVPRVPLGGLLPTPALSWLEAAGAQVRLRMRVTAVEARSNRWRLHTRAVSATPEREGRDASSAPGTAGEAIPGDGDFEGVIVAATATEAARMCGTLSPAWSAVAAALPHEPIATLWLRTPRRHWPTPMLALPSDIERRPAQFAFKLPPCDPSAADARLRGAAEPGRATDRITLVVSAAAPWVERGLAHLRDAASAQAREALGFRPEDEIECVDARIDRRATFRCAAGVARPPAQVADGIVAAGDYIDGPYPSTLEAAVRSGESAVAMLQRPHRLVTA